MLKEKYLKFSLCVFGCVELVNVIYFSGWIGNVLVNYVYIVYWLVSDDYCGGGVI